MDSEAKAFETPFLSDIGRGTPLRCYRRMPAQPLEVPTPLSLLGLLAISLMPAPRALLPAPSTVRSSRRA